MEERTSIVEVGDKLHHDTAPGIISEVTRVVRGSHGMFVESYWHDEATHRLLPYELPPTEDRGKFYQWPFRASITVEDGPTLGYVSFEYGDPRCGNASEYFAEWGKTIDAMKAEEGVMQSRPTDIRLN